MSKRDRTRFIVIHCSATKPGVDIGVNEIREWHIAKGWSDVGYHFVIRRDGQIEAGRHPDDIGAHVAGHNTDSIGICLVGGLDMDGHSFVERPDLYTLGQWEATRALLRVLRRMYPAAQVLGHRDLSPDRNHDGKIQPGEWVKTCPGFDVLHHLVNI